MCPWACLELGCKPLHSANSATTTLSLCGRWQSLVPQGALNSYMPGPPGTRTTWAQFLRSRANGPSLLVLLGAWYIQHGSPWLFVAQTPHELCWVFSGHQGRSLGQASLIL